RFLGYETLTSESRVLAILKEGKEVSVARSGEEVEVVLDRTPFYGEAGGQVGDRGWLLHDAARMEVAATLKFGQDFIVHQGKVLEGALSTGVRIEARVDRERRMATARNHTATHLLHAALRHVLGDHVKQAGSLVSPDRFRFDFSHFTQVRPELLREVEKIVNRNIRDNHPLATEELSREEAMKTGAMAIFEERYGDRVRLVRVGDGLSMELCGGTHCSRTGDIGLFKIVSEGAVGANVRRIEALTGDKAVEYVQNREEELQNLALLLKTSPEQISEKVERLLKEHRQKEKEMESLRAKLLTSRSLDLLDGVRELDGVKVLAREVEADSPRALRDFADRIKEKIGSGIVLLGARSEGKAMVICMVTQDLVMRYKAGEIVARLSALVGGKGGGRADMAQGGGNRPEDLRAALEAVYDIVKNQS
ncbi:MAG: alanine--tRNA ligase, partial [Deltaproteobacteria bacterium]|nr:alanine--tRNA ligase [Deltaproteobacteria bacterium]